LSWVAEDEEAPLAEAASEAIRKVEAMLPPHGGDTQSLPSDDAPPPDIIRAAIAGELKLHLDYRDAKGRATARIVWPLELEEYDDTGMIAAWCEHRGDFRNFRLDRIRELHLLERYPVRRKTLLARLQLQQSANDWY
jgi:predicted DNA-binding transcriptional regulator YafY